MANNRLANSYAKGRCVCHKYVKSPNHKAFHSWILIFFLFSGQTSHWKAYIFIWTPNRNGKVSFVVIESYIKCQQSNQKNVIQFIVVPITSFITFFWLDDVIVAMENQRKIVTKRHWIVWFEWMFIWIGVPIAVYHANYIKISWRKMFLACQSVDGSI